MALPFPAEKNRAGSKPLAALIREWLPFLLSAAITAGVAPLLFVQIVYPRNFYTANLLLSWKWMIVVPLIIVAFYLLYLSKSRVITRWSLAARAFVTLATAGCFVFVGFCWTANHLLGNAESRWSDVYVTGNTGLDATEVAARMFVWIGASFASLTTLAAWQLRSTTLPDDLPPAETKRLTVMAIGGLFVSTASAIVYLCLIAAETRNALLSASAAPYLLLTAVGLAVQLLAWWKIGVTRAIHLAPLTATSIGLACSLIGASVVREILRLQMIDISAMYTRHADASGVGGLAVFALFAIVNFSLIGCCIWLVRTECADRLGGKLRREPLRSTWRRNFFSANTANCLHKSCGIHRLNQRTLAHCSERSITAQRLQPSQRNCLTCPSAATSWKNCTARVLSNCLLVRW